MNIPGCIIKQGGVISQIVFNLYIDTMLIQLLESRIDCHMNNVLLVRNHYLSKLLRGLNKMLEICIKHAAANHINSKKTVCI